MIMEQGIEAIYKRIEGWCVSFAPRSDIEASIKEGLEAYEKSKWRPIEPIDQQREWLFLFKDGKVKAGYFHGSYLNPDYWYAPTHYQALPTPPQGDEG